ncbi:venom peptide SjAPI-2 [Vespula squamosa]|uniref:Venom peptide SjAPI-2 n=1 Tax=Vespula squamosa TaxID=30214 RepID=A0ABD2BS13_VESSQ
MSPIVCTSACGPNKVFIDCMRPCLLTYANYKNLPKFCATYCKEECSCVNGTILNSEKECVLPSQC